MNKRKSKFVEIYFVLYLAALILLLPGKKESEDVITFGTSGMPNMSLDAEKQILYFRFKLSNGNLYLISADSINNIYFNGIMDNLRFEYEILDKNLLSLSKISYQEKYNSKYYTITNDTENKKSQFKWIPADIPISGANYTVIVKAKGKPLDSFGNAPEIEISSRFLVAIYVEGVDDINESNSSLVESRVDTIRVFQNIDKSSSNDYTDKEFTIDVADRVISSIAFKKWSNIIYTSGINPQTQLLKSPELKIDIDNNEYKPVVKEIRENYIIVEGITPPRASSNIEVSFTRKGDLREVSTQFKIKNVNIRKPELPREMIAETEYVINTNLPQVSGIFCQALLKVGNNLIAQSLGQNPIVITPPLSDTGKIYVLERYFDDFLIEQGAKIKIVNNPKPELLAWSVKDNKLLLQTKVFGYYGSKINEVVKLEIEPKLSNRELYGNARSENGYTIQHFEIDLKGASKIVKLKIIDKKSLKSDEITINY